VEKDDQGNILCVKCTYDPATRGGWSSDGRKVKGTIHWVEAESAIPIEVRLYDRLFTVPDPEARGDGEDWKSFINPDSLKVVQGCLAEPSLLDAKPGDKVQFERTGYFCMDPDSRDGMPVFNRAVPLRDSWAKLEKALQE